MSSMPPQDHSILLLPETHGFKDASTTGTSAAMPQSVFAQCPFSPNIMRKHDEMQIFKSENQSRNNSLLALPKTPWSPDTSYIYHNGIAPVQPVFKETTYKVESSSGPLKKAFSSYSRQCFLLISILVITLTLVVILLTIQFRTETSKGLVPQSLATDTKTQTMSAELKLFSYEPTKTSSVKVNSPEDIQNPENSQTLIVECLVDELVNISSKTNFETIKYAQIVGPVSEEWLVRLLTVFPKIQTLSLDIDNLCIGSQVKDRSSLQTLKLENLKNLNIVNSNMCLLANWVYGWDLPALTTFSIKDSDITKHNYNELNDFVGRKGKTLKAVSIVNCFVCDGCALPEPHDGFELKIEKAVNAFDYDD